MIAVTVLGSTGSVGTQTLEVLSNMQKIFSIYGLSCHTNIDLLEKQIATYHPEVVAVSDGAAARRLKKRLAASALGRNRPRVFAGESGLKRLAAAPKTHTLVLGIHGEKAIQALKAAIQINKRIVLVNKEALVCHGSAIQKIMEKSQAKIIPGDSEHFAILRCIQARNDCLTPPSRIFSLPRENTHILPGILRLDTANIKKIFISCSGGPFFGKKRSDFKNVSLEAVINHPTWKMGKKISIDSATLMNKGLEIVEAHLLFGLPYKKIDVFMHPECVIHGMIHFQDGTVGVVQHRPDMRITLALALLFDLNTKEAKQELLQRNNAMNITFSTFKNSLLYSQNFKNIDHETFPGIMAVCRAVRSGQKKLRKLCCSNETWVQNFLAGRITFLELLDFIERFS